MIHMGQMVPEFRLPILVQGSLQIIDSRYLQGQWVALCFANSLSVTQAAFLEGHMEQLREEQTFLFAVTPHMDLPDHTEMSRLAQLHLPILVDTLKRVHRAFHVSLAAFRTNCDTFLIDPRGSLQFHLIHTLTHRGMKAVRTIVGEKRRLVAGSVCCPVD